jgi:Ca-activated chloride channel family protein
MEAVRIFAFIFLAVVASWTQDTGKEELPVTPAIRDLPAREALKVPFETRSQTIRRNVDVVLVPVTVTDSKDRVVSGLEREHFAVYEGPVRQEIRYFLSEDTPISLGIVLDVSGSMADKFDKAREALAQFFNTANAEDEFFLVTVADRPQLISDFTSSIEDIQNKLLFTEPKGLTALVDTIYLALNKAKQGKYEKRALLVISDGGDNHSRYSQGELKKFAQEADTQVYAIGVHDHPRTKEECRGPLLLAEIAEATGGRAFIVTHASELPDIAAKIGLELRNQYVLGYHPTNPKHDGKWHKIKVKLIPPKGVSRLRVHAKTRYYAPAE